MSKRSGRRSAMREWKRAMRKDSRLDPEAKRTLAALADAYGYVGSDGNTYMALPAEVTK